MIVRFSVPGEVRGKGRPRTTTISGHARMYTDARTASYENRVAVFAREALGSCRPFAAPVSLHLMARFVPPRSASKKMRAAMLAGDVVPGKKPDLSNILKACEDGMNGIVYTDDALIVRIVADKRYAETAGVDVIVKAVE